MTLDELVHITTCRLAELGLDRLADGRIAAELSSRTVRFLRQAEVLSRPEGAGPAATWGMLHLEQLLTARALQAAGCSVAECAERIRGLDEPHLATLREQTLSQLDLRRSTPTPAGQGGSSEGSRDTHPIEPCAAWCLSPQFTLVANGPATLSRAKLEAIRQILDA